MKKLLFSFIIFIPFILSAQHAGGTFFGKNYVLIGETEIVLKDGSKVSCHDRIDGTKIGKTDIDYKNVDYIRLVKTELKGYDSHNESIYKYVFIKNKPKFVKVIIETSELSFYLERPKMTGGGYNAVGQFQNHGTSSKLFMVKNNSQNAEKVDFGKNYDKIAKIFPDCPKFSEYKNNKKLRSELTLEKICEIYNNCQ